MSTLPTLIVLAAGCGTRLGDAARARPKCMAEVHGRPLLAWQIDAARQAGCEDIVVVRGYRAACIDLPGVAYVDNPDYATTNMVGSLLAARARWGRAFAVAYGDILYAPAVLEAVWAGEAPIAVAVDRSWRGYWTARFDDPLDDAETLAVDGQGRITDIGRRPAGFHEIEGQYIGLSAFRDSGVEALATALDRERAEHERGRRRIAPARAFPDLHMTDVLQALVRDGQPVRAALIDGGWLEIDRPGDLELAASLSRAPGAVLEIRR